MAGLPDGGFDSPRLHHLNFLAGAYFSTGTGYLDPQFLEPVLLKGLLCFQAFYFFDNGLHGNAGDGLCRQCAKALAAATKVGDCSGEPEPARLHPEVASPS